MLLFNKRPPAQTGSLFRLAWPLLLSNCTVPLLGLVDTAVLGHLPDGRYLAAVALGAVIFSFLYWGFGFLRMGTTGLVAQTWGQEDRKALGRVIFQALTLALLLGLALQLLRPFIPGLLSLLDSSPDARLLASDYVAIRLWSAPAVLMQYVVLGLAIGLGRTGVVLWLLILGNGINILLDLWFVMGLGLTSNGVAFASLIAETSAAAVGLIWLVVTCKALQIPLQRPVPDPASLKKLIQVNSDLFIRTLALLLALAFFTRQGAAQGNEVLAANAVLMQLVMLSSYLLDGFAQAVEGRFGTAFARSHREAREVYKAGLFLSVMTATAITLAAWLGGPWLIQQLTDLEDIRQLATTYLPWLWLILPVSLWCYLYDGVFIGATWTAAMRNSLLIALVGYLLAWWLLQDYDNHGLWAAFLVFNALRGLTLGWVFRKRFSLTVTKQ
ncbi:MATE family efflux transporter [Marinospirillum sp.]|uniref:MATE family efflux transporter n=1 Tax=Marinospirillum sp. TaxID=2183934 RepID=UPI0038517981